jgi:AcrR family transcriptional regulator
VIIDAALRVLDREGMDGLSMRKVADELKTGAASLYWHVRNKDELLQRLFEKVTQDVELPEPDPSRWQEQLRDLANQMRRAMHNHRDIARISLGRIPTGPSIALTTEWLFQLLGPVGVPDQVIAYLGDLFGLYVGAYAFEESLGLASPTGEDLPPHEIIGMLQDYLRSLPADRFPHTVRNVDLLTTGGPEARFEFGVETIIKGIEAHARDARTNGDMPA